MHVPIKQSSRKELKVRSKPWITPAIRKSIQIKNNLYKKYIKSKSTYYHIRFKLYRNKINHLLKISKKQYYNQYFHDNITDGKKIWKGIKQIVQFKPNTNQKLVKVMDNNEEISDAKSIANAFNNYFSNIGKELDNQIPRGHSNPMDYLHSPVKDSFFLFPTTRREIEVEISNLRTSKAVGPFSIPLIYLKLLNVLFLSH